MMFKEFLRFNGDVILKNLKLIPLNLDDPLMIFNSNNESYLVIDSRSSSFSQAQQESFKEKLHLSFCKNESDNDEKTQFFKELQEFKEKLGFKNQKMVKKIGRKAAKSFSAKPMVSQSNNFEEKKDVLSKKEFKELENKLKNLIGFCKKEEKDFNKTSFWELLFSNQKLLTTLMIIFEDSLKSQDALVSVF